MTRDAADWISQNQLLLTKYKGKYVAITDRIIASGDCLADVVKIANEQDTEYVIYYVPKYVNMVRILPIHIKPLAINIWQPLYPIELLHVYETTKGNVIHKEEALIDSGADITCLPYDLGIYLGLEKYPQEMFLVAYGFGGEVSYFQRQIPIKIDGHKIYIPAAWIQGADTELIIGRAVVFDCFDITFRQHSKKIEFVWLDNRE